MVFLSFPFLFDIAWMSLSLVLGEGLLTSAPSAGLLCQNRCALQKDAGMYIHISLSAFIGKILKTDGTIIQFLVGSDWRCQLLGTVCF